jgi:hypothetical protein
MRRLTYMFLVALTGVVLVIGFVPSAAGIAHAHPGNTDSSGGHTCRTNCERWGLNYGQYHYHSGPVSPQRTNPASPSVRNASPEAAIGGRTIVAVSGAVLLLYLWVASKISN